MVFYTEFGVGGGMRIESVLSDYADQLQVSLWLPDSYLFRGWPPTILVNILSSGGERNLLAFEALLSREEDGTRRTWYLGRAWVTEDLVVLEWEVPPSLIEKVAHLVVALRHGRGRSIAGWARVGPVTPWRPRLKRQAEKPVTQGKPCDYCKCDDCQGEVEEPPFQRHSLLLASGHRMCDICAHYPPCGMGDDCEEYDLKGWCQHRPPLKEGHAYPARHTWAKIPGKGETTGTLEDAGWSLDRIYRGKKKYLSVGVTEKGVKVYVTGVPFKVPAFWCGWPVEVEVVGRIQPI